MKLYVFNISNLTDMSAENLIDATRRKRMERYQNIDDRKRCLAAGLMLRKALGSDCEKIKKTSEGKPFLPDGPSFNLSHSGDYVILGVSEHEVGVDIEQVRTYDERVAQRCFTEDELKWLKEQDNPDAFFKLWTVKEAIVKADGRGFGISPHSFSVLPVEDSEHIIDGKSWHLIWQQLNGYVICTACECQENIEIIFEDDLYG